MSSEQGCYPGRKLPPTHTVEHAKEDAGAARAARLKQLGENRKEINKVVEKNEGQ